MITPEPGPSLSAPVPVPWELALVRSWRKLALTFAAALSVASVLWQVTHRGMAYDFVFHPDVVARVAYLTARLQLVALAAGAGLLALPLCARVLLRVRRGQPVPPFHREVLVASLLPLPLLTVPGLEFDHPLFTAAIVLAVSAALAWVVSREAKDLPDLPDLTPRQAALGVAAAIVVFVATIGFIAYWRYITFHAQVCDSSWDTNAIWGIVHNGYPTISVNAWMYDGQALPAPYFNNHVVFGSYLYAPFFALHQTAGTLTWMQAVFMGLGAIGAYLIGRKWLGSRWMGVLAAWLYVLNPSVQSLCLHDIHPNILVVPSLMLAVGLMEANRTRAAVACAVFTAICHEETPLYAMALGLFWMLTSEDRRRFRVGLAVCVMALILAVTFSSILMPYFGGHPRWDHFNFFFDERRSSGSLVGALILNPLGAVLSTVAEIKLDYLTMSLVPLGALALLGGRAGWFMLPAVMLLVPANSEAFFGPGINYSTPLVPAVLLMSLAGLRRVWPRTAPADRGRRSAVVVYVLATALMGNYLYGNIAGKSFKLEYGFSPFRRQNQYNYRDIVGYTDALPPFGGAERAVWELLAHVPPKASLASSWAINPQLASRGISLALGFSGGTPAPEDRVDYLVIDKLPSLQVPTEPLLERFRADPRFHVVYENAGGVVFKRQR